jgi:hypothetical protein
MTLDAIIALGAAALVLVVLAIALWVPPTAARARAPRPRRRPQWAPARSVVEDVPVGHAPQALHPAVRSAREQIRRFLVLIASERRSVRDFRIDHPEMDLVLLGCVSAVVLGALIAKAL